jgi:predicted RNase H-like nuclease (RuvC/YqgF family)
MLKFKGSYIVNQDDKKVASLVDRFPVITNDERYAVDIDSIFDYMTADQIKSYIQAAEQLQTENIVQAAMLKSFKNQLEQKLHTCLMETNLQYRYEFEVKILKQQIQQLEQWLDEERRKRYKLENELFELKNSQQESESEEKTECQD